MKDAERERLTDLAVLELFKTGWSLDNLVAVFNIKRFRAEEIIRSGLPQGGDHGTYR